MIMRTATAETNFRQRLRELVGCPGFVQLLPPSDEGLGARRP